MSDQAQEELIASVEGEIQQREKARKIFDSIKDIKREPGCEFQVFVIGSVGKLETKDPEDLEREKTHGIGVWFDLTSNSDLFTTENPEPGSSSDVALKFVNSFMKEMDRGPSSDENNLTKIIHSVNLKQTGGIEPEEGDIIVTLVDMINGGVLGAVARARVIKPKMTETETKEALSYIASQGL